MLRAAHSWIVSTFNASAYASARRRDTGGRFAAEHRAEADIQLEPGEAAFVDASEMDFGHARVFRHVDGGRCLAVPNPTGEPIEVAAPEGGVQRGGPDCWIALDPDKPDSRHLIEGEEFARDYQVEPDLGIYRPADPDPGSAEYIGQRVVDSCALSGSGHEVRFADGTWHLIDDPETDLHPDPPAPTPDQVASLTVEQSRAAAETLRTYDHRERARALEQARQHPEFLSTLDSAYDELEPVMPISSGLQGRYLAMAAREYAAAQTVRGKIDDRSYQVLAEPWESAFTNQEKNR